MEHDRKMDHPSNGVAIVGCLRPAFADEELYLRRLFHFEDNDRYTLDWKGFIYRHPGSIFIIVDPFVTKSNYWEESGL